MAIKQRAIGGRGQGGAPPRHPRRRRGALPRAPRPHGERGRGGARPRASPRARSTSTSRARRRCCSRCTSATSRTSSRALMRAARRARARRLRRDPRTSRATTSCACPGYLPLTSRCFGAHGPRHPDRRRRSPSRCAWRRALTAAGARARAPLPAARARRRRDAAAAQLRAHRGPVAARCIPSSASARRWSAPSCRLFKRDYEREIEHGAARALVGDDGARPTACDASRADAAKEAAHEIPTASSLARGRPRSPPAATGRKPIGSRAPRAHADAWRRAPPRRATCTRAKSARASRPTSRSASAARSSRAASTPARA